MVCVVSDFIAQEEDMLKGWHCGLPGQPEGPHWIWGKKKISTVHLKNLPIKMEL